MDARTVRRIQVAGALLVTWVVVLAVLPGLSHEHDVSPTLKAAAVPRSASNRRGRGASPDGGGGGDVDPAFQEDAETTRAARGRKAAKRRKATRPPTAAPAEDGADASSAGSAGSSSTDDAAAPEAAGKTMGIVQPLLPKAVVSLLRKSRMIDILGDTRLNERCAWTEKESSSNVAFMKAFAPIMRDAFPPERGGAPDGSGLHWFLDEGGLIGSGRAGSMANADDDFDFFALLPRQWAPCRPDSLTCTEAEFEKYIHGFLMTFWRAGMCINKFHPDPAKFKSRRRLMYSFQLNRKDDVPPERCFIEGKPFAHMHLGMFTPEGRIKTNIWAAGTTHPMDELDLSLMLPVRRCRAGPVDAPCPANITGFLTVRNRGEYRKGGDGTCLLVRKKWGAARKKGAANTTQALADCGYNSMVNLVPTFVASEYRTC